MITHIKMNILLVEIVQLIRCCFLVKIIHVQVDLS